MNARSVVCTAIMLGFLAGCSESPTVPEQSSSTQELSALLAEVGAVDDSAEAVRLGAPHVPTINLLLHHALMKVASEQGAEAARSIAVELREKQHQIRRKALEEGTPEARRRAAAAIELEMAKVVVRILGPEVVERVMGIAEDRIAALEARIEAAPDSANTTRAERLLELLKEELAKATAALPTNPAQALIHALKAMEGAHRLIPGHRPPEAAAAA